MCGIAGFSLHPSETVNAKRLAKNLLLGIEYRGKDATGAAWIDPTGDVQVQKGALPASIFCRNLSVWKQAGVAILHTRYATQGTEKNNVNNHPVMAGSLVGVHNGVVTNDYELFYEMGIADRRVGQVDTEAVFAALMWGANLDAKGQPLVRGAVDIPSTLEAIEGSAALAWLDRADDVPGRLHLARTASSPLFLAQTDAGSLLFASHPRVLKEAAEAAKLTLTWEHEAPEGEYLTVVNGAIVEKQEFLPAWSWAPAPQRSQYSAFATNTKTTKAHRPFRFASPKSFGNDLSSKFLSVGTAIDPDEGVAWYREANATRDRLIEDYLDEAATNGVGDSLFMLHPDVRPGDWVKTSVAGASVHAQVYTCPDTFPQGKYVLRVLLPNPERHTTEVVLLGRTWDEFEEWSSSTLAGSTPTAGTTLEAVGA